MPSIKIYPIVPLRIMHTWTHRFGMFTVGFAFDVEVVLKTAIALPDDREK
jgi:hypothetical protein